MKMIFVSSTLDDLTVEREAIRQSFSKEKFEFVGFETIPNVYENNRADRFSAIESCNIFALIVGHKYGPIFSDTGYSMMEMEYNYAFSKQIPILVYFKDDQEKILLSHIETSPTGLQKLNNFKKLLKERHTIKSFSKPDNLLYKLIKDINSLLPFLDYQVNKDTNGQDIKCIVAIPQRPQYVEAFNKSIVPVLKTHNIEFSLEEIHDDGALTLELPKKLLQTDIIIFDISEPYVSIYFNLGCLAILNRNIILIANSLARLKIKVDNIDIIYYNQLQLPLLSSKLTDALKKIL